MAPLGYKLNYKFLHKMSMSSASLNGERGNALTEWTGKLGIYLALYDPQQRSLA